MPELPEVETVARDLAKMVAGARVNAGRIIRAANLSTPDPTTFSRAIAGRRIEGVRRRAKWILVDLEGGLILMVHLRMTGQLLVLPRAAAIDPYIRAILTLADGRELRFRDVRAFGRLALVARRDDGAPAASLDPADDAALSDHGPEPLEVTFTVAAFSTSASRASTSTSRASRASLGALDSKALRGGGSGLLFKPVPQRRPQPLALLGQLVVLSLAGAGAGAPNRS